MNCVMLANMIEEKRITITALAEELGLSRQGLYNKLNGEREFVGSEIKKITAVLGLTDEERNAIFFDNDVGINANNADAAPA